jgi:hypothetical protein
MLVGLTEANLPYGRHGQHLKVLKEEGLMRQRNHSFVAF